jgi:hypothetical protein
MASAIGAVTERMVQHGALRKFIFNPPAMTSTMKHESLLSVQHSTAADALLSVASPFPVMARFKQVT